MSDLEDEEPTCPCKKEIVNCPLIECDDCKTNYHTVCCGLEGLTPAPVTKLMIKKWKCPRCFKFGEDMPAQNKEPEPTRLNQQIVSDIITIVNSTVEENLKTLLSPENLQKADEGNAAPFIPVTRRRRHNSIQDAIQEQREEEVLIDKKKDNLIIYGVPEAATEDKKEEMLEDYRKIKKAYEGKATVNKEDLHHITRLGKKENNKVRPIQITLASQNKRKELLTKNMNLKFLEDDTSTNIYVSPDRTKKQREADKLLRQELKHRKKNEPNLVIRNSKIVSFRPDAQDYPTWASLFE